MTSATTTPPTRAEASKHLYEALSHHALTLDLAASDPLVIAIVEYGDRCAAHDDASRAKASRHIYQALTHRSGPRDFSARDEFTLALAEYGEACWAEGKQAVRHTGP